MNREQQLFSATMARFVAQREEAKAILLTYFTSSVGVGEHSDHLNEIIKWARMLAEAEECLTTLKKHFQQPDDTE